VRDLSSKFPSFWSGKVKWMLSLYVLVVIWLFWGGNIRVWTRSLMLGRQSLYHLSQVSSAWFDIVFRIA
jgi:hypothetical protein